MVSMDRVREAMGRALFLANRAREDGDVPVGAVVIDSTGKVIGQGWNRREVDHDPSAHAEIIALREAGKRMGRWNLVGCTLVVTLEPCTMCAGAAVQARLDAVVFAAWDPKAGAGGSVRDVLRDSRLNHQVEVIGGVLEEEATIQLRAFFTDRRGSQAPETGASPVVRQTPALGSTSTPRSWENSTRRPVVPPMERIGGASGPRGAQVPSGVPARRQAPTVPTLPNALTRRSGNGRPAPESPLFSRASQTRQNGAGILQPVIAAATVGAGGAAANSASEPTSSMGSRTAAPGELPRRQGRTRRSVARAQREAMEPPRTTAIPIGTRLRAGTGNVQVPGPPGVGPAVSSEAGSRRAVIDSPATPGSGVTRPAPRRSSPTVPGATTGGIPTGGLAMKTPTTAEQVMVTPNGITVRRRRAGEPRH